MTQNLRRAALAMLALSLSGSADATFVVNLPWARPLAHGASAQVFMNLTSTDAATLIAVRGPDGSTAALRDARGRQVRPLALPAAETVRLSPRNAHVLLRGLQRRPAIGSHLPLVLTIADRNGVQQDIPLNAEVRRRSVLEDEGPGHAHHAH